MNTAPPLQFKYQTLEFGGVDMHIKTLKNTNQFSDDDDEAKDLGISSAQWPLFGVIWPSGIILGHEMVTLEIENKKILEVGCGMAVASHVLNARGADITATDYHPEANTFLLENAELNKKKEIPFVLENWDTDQSQLDRFDIIVGSDILYEQAHIPLLSNFLHAHAKDKCEIIIVDPNRGHANKFTRCMQALGFTHEQKKSEVDANFKGNIHHYAR